MFTFQASLLLKYSVFFQKNTKYLVLKYSKTSKRQKENLALFQTYLIFLHKKNDSILASFEFKPVYCTLVVDER